MSHRMTSPSRSYDQAETFIADFGGYLTDPEIHGYGMKGLPQGLSGPGMGDFLQDLVNAGVAAAQSAGQSAAGTAFNSLMQTQTGQQLQQQAAQEASKGVISQAVDKVYAQGQTTLAWIKKHPVRTAAIGAGVVAGVALVAYLVVKGATASVKRG